MFEVVASAMTVLWCEVGGPSERTNGERAGRRSAKTHRDGSKPIPGSPVTSFLPTPTCARVRDEGCSVRGAG